MANSETYYNNADSFCMAFHDIFKDKIKQKIDASQNNKLISEILNILNDHPFVISHPERAKEIAKFRLSMISESNI
tara:strand:- start:887 stop:1114 length:228 start_codon:yes stop_codon:yes gene_type:complete